MQPPSDHSSDSSVTEADRLDPHKHSPSLQATMESVAESSKAISESLFISLILTGTRRRFSWKNLRIVGFELDKVAQDFDKLTPPESSKNIIFRLIHYDDKSYAFAWIEKITDAMKPIPRKIQLRKPNGKRRKFNYAIPIYDPTVDSDAFDLILDDFEQCYWPMVLRRVLHNDEDFGDYFNCDGDAVEDVNEDAVKDVNEDANEDDVDEDDVDDEIEYKDEFEFQQIIRMRFKPKKSYKEDDDEEEEKDEDDDDDGDADEYNYPNEYNYPYY
ncbi:uncharacterized protein LOC142640003 [Castanea sativa]|uniref:uncharacterized protein LOC142640003 n=1 Tax=Castanea sativa TaxID=21020 RepID=UPI003F64DC63